MLLRRQNHGSFAATTKESQAQAHMGLTNHVNLNLQGAQTEVPWPSLHDRNLLKVLLFNYFGEQGSPISKEKAPKRGRRCSPWAHTLSARSQRLYGAFGNLFRLISNQFKLIFDENH